MTKGLLCNSWRQIADRIRNEGGRGRDLRASFGFKRGDLVTTLRLVMALIK